MTVLVAWAMGIEMDLNFNRLETACLALSILVTSFTLQVRFLQLIWLWLNIITKICISFDWIHSMIDRMGLRTIWKAWFFFCVILSLLSASLSLIHLQVRFAVFPPQLFILCLHLSALLLFCTINSMPFILFCTFSVAAETITTYHTLTERYVMFSYLLINHVIPYALKIEVRGCKWVHYLVLVVPLYTIYI